ncbi:MAG: PEGA domain-containing protein, partial [Planctomycetales bacterium]
FLALLGIVAFLASGDSQAKLVLDWPSDDRADAELRIDGEQVAVPESGPVEYPLPPGEHAVVIVRPGFTQVELAVTLEAGETSSLQPEWLAVVDASPPKEDDPDSSADTKDDVPEVRPEDVVVDDDPPDLSAPEEPVETPPEPPWGITEGLFLTFSDHAGGVRSVAFSPDGIHVASAGDDGVARVWNLPDEKAVHEFDAHPGGALCVAFSADGKRLISGGRDHAARLWDLETGMQIRAFEGHAGDVKHVFLDEADDRLTTVDAERSARVWTLSSGVQESAAVVGNLQDRWSQDPTADFAISSGYDGHVRLWSLDEGTEIWRFPTPDRFVSSVVLGRKGARALTGGAKGDLRLWGIETKRELRRWAAHAGPIWTIDLAPDGEQAVSAGQDAKIRVWNLKTGSQVAELEGHSAAVVSVDVSADGAAIVSGSRDGTVRVWGIPVPEESTSNPGSIVKADRLLQVPDKTAQSSLLKELRTRHKSEYVRRAPGEKSAFVVRLVESAAATIDNPHLKFILLQEA